MKRTLQSNKEIIDFEQKLGNEQLVEKIATKGQKVYETRRKEATQSERSPPEVGNLAPLKALLDINLFTVKAFEEQILDKQNNLCGILIDQNALDSLQPGEQLDDNAVNGFYALLEIIGDNNGLSVLSFESYVVQKLLAGLISSSRVFYDNREKLFLLEKDLWLMPVIIPPHWTLLAVFFKTKTIIYFDSMKNDTIPENLLENTIEFIDRYLIASTGKEIDLNEWAAFFPQNTSKQTKGSQNCGLFGCCCGFQMCTGNKKKFRNKDAENSRAVINEALLLQGIEKIGQREERALLSNLLPLNLEPQFYYTTKTKIPYSKSTPAPYRSLHDFCSGYAKCGFEEE